MKTNWCDFIKSNDYLDAAANFAYYMGIQPGRSNGKTRFMKYYEEYPEIIEKENKPMRQCDIDFEKKKVDLKKEMDQALFDLQTKWEEDRSGFAASTIRNSWIWRKKSVNPKLKNSLMSRLRH